MNEDRKVEEFFEHHGIKGMKWGVRRKRGSNERVSTERKRADEVLNKKKKTGPRSLTNKDLADFNKRLELETKFTKLTPSKRKIGEAHVAALLATAGLGVGVYNMYNSPAGKALIDAGKKFVIKS